MNAFKASVLKNPATYLLLTWLGCVEIRYKWVQPYLASHFVYPPGGYLVVLSTYLLPAAVVAVLWVRDFLAHR